MPYTLQRNCFNSQPHEEADTLPCESSGNASVSTHSLTRRLTTFPVPCKYANNVSTHSLTRRLTSVCHRLLLSTSVSTHSLTRRLTTQIFQCFRFASVSTHSLTRRLTTLFRTVPTCQPRFNSQPHEEADCRSRITCRFSIVSTHSLTRRLTILYRHYMAIYACFNSQPHEEADGNFEQKYLLRNCIFYNYCIYYFLYLSCIQLFMHFFSLNLPIFRCECPRESCVLSFRTYNIKVSVTSKPGLAPICSILFLYFSPK